MKKLFLISLIVFATTAHSRNDGSWWNSLDDTGKTYYLFGYLNGIANTAFLVPAFICGDPNFAGEDIRKCLENAMRTVNAKIASPIAGRPYGQFIAGIGTFYKDYKNLNICFKVALSVVTKEINGMKQEDVRDWVEKVRAIPATDPCD